MTITEHIARVRAILDEVDDMLGVNPTASRPTVKGRPLAEMIYAAAKPARKRGRPKGSKNKPKE